MKQTKANEKIQRNRDKTNGKKKSKNRIKYIVHKFIGNRRSESIKRKTFHSWKVNEKNWENEAKKSEKADKKTQRNRVERVRRGKINNNFSLSKIYCYFLAKIWLFHRNKAKQER